MEVLTINEETPEYNQEERILTIDNTFYQFRKIYRTGLNILPEYYEILHQLSNGVIGEYLKYLYYKYHKQILILKVAHTKRTATADYQPIRKRYIQITLNISPYIWEKYWELRRITGYSISFIVRIFLEWELQEQNQNNLIENGEPLISSHPEIEIININYPVYFFQNSYAVFKRGNSITNDIFIYYKDIFY
jgi:hypothetical protein